METPPGWTILSFDIGIKNLAYCLISLDPEKKYQIIDWDVINLIPESKKQTCGATIKYSGKKSQELGITEKTCGKVASVHYRQDDELIPYCKTHLPEKTKKPGIPIKLAKISKVSNQDMNMALVQALDKLPHLLDCDEVLLEHQPSKNAQMKNLSFMIYSYFIIRGLVDRPESRLKSIQHKQINSDKKLSIYDGPPVECSLKNKYDQNKYFSKIYCEHLIRNDSKWLPIFQTAKKKDDLADCFLQGAWFLQKHAKKKSK